MLSVALLKAPTAYDPPTASCLLGEGDTETPSVPARPGTSSLPISSPRQLCRWRRTAAVGIAASPPPEAPP